MSESVSRALCEAYTAYPASWRRKRRAPEIDIWAASVALDWLAALKPRSVDMLDVGCGEGRFCRLLAAEGIAAAVDARAFAVPHGEHAIEPAFAAATSNAPSVGSPMILHIAPSCCNVAPLHNTAAVRRSHRPGGNSGCRAMSAEFGAGITD